MNATISAQDKPVLDILHRVRAILPETAGRYGQLKGASDEALRKRMERLAEKDFLATSALPSGRQIFRLSRKGVKLTGSPTSWAASPTCGILAEALSVSALAWKKDDFLFPTRSEFERLLKDLGGEQIQVPPRVTRSRFVLRTMKGEHQPEMRLDYWLAELRPAAALASRAEVVAINIAAVPVFKRLIAAGLFGISIAVPTNGVRATLETNALSIPAHIVVVEELQHLAPV
jgi:hypothetical protein